MEGLLILLGIAWLALPIVTFIMVLNARGDRAIQNQQISHLAVELAALRDEFHRVRRDVEDLRRARLTGIREELDEDRAGDQPETLPEAAPGMATSEPPLEPAAPDNVPPAAEPAAAVPGRSPIPQVPAPRRRSLADLEGAIGARWSVIVGGIAVALGAIFLVRYSIEAGLLGPRARIGAGALFSAALFAAGEWLRRRDKALALPIAANADIPGILTGTGAVGAFATVYAAHALYGFIGPGAAFVALTIVGLASLVLSAIHGPKLAAIGVLGAYAAPLLVASDAPNPVALALHVVVVTASVMGVARLRDWLWLALAGVVGGTGYSMLSAAMPGIPALGIAGLIFTIGLPAIFAATFGYGVAERPVPPQDRPLDLWATGAFAALALAFLVQAAGNGQLPLVPAGLAASLIAVGAAVFWPALSAVALAGVAVALIAIAGLRLNLVIEPGVTNLEALRLGVVPLDIPAFLREAALIAVPPAALAVWGAWRNGVGARQGAGWLASAFGVISFLALVLTYLRVAPFETRPGFGAAGLVLAFACGALVARFSALDPDDRTAPAPAAFAVASVAALCFAIAVSLDSGWMPLAFALATAGIAWVWTQRPVSVLPWLALAAAVIGTLTLIASLPFDAATIGTTPVLNRLIVLLGLPAAAMIAGGELLRRREADMAGSLAAALGMAVLGLFVALEIRHWINGGTIAGGAPGLGEVGAQTLAALGFSIGLQRIGGTTGGWVYRYAANVAGAISAILIGFGLLILQNPYITNDPVGQRAVANLLLPGYLLPALAAGAVALMSRGVRPRWYTLGFAALSGLLLFAFVSLTVRHAFQGEYLGAWRSTSDAEFWTYSVVWLLTGAALLALGLWLNSLPIRAASGLLIALTVCKVFLLDMAALSGPLRALSFIGLGLSLLAIGRFYQMVVLRRAAPPPAPPESPPGEGGQSA